MWPPWSLDLAGWFLTLSLMSLIRLAELSFCVGVIRLAESSFSVEVLVLVLSLEL